MGASLQNPVPRGRAVSLFDSSNFLYIDSQSTAGVMMDRLSSLGSRSELSSDSIAPSILAINGVFTFVALVVVVLQIYVRAAMLNS